MQIVEMAPGKACFSEAENYTQFLRGVISIGELGKFWWPGVACQALAAAGPVLAQLNQGQLHLSLIHI